eukprot:1161896-Pelagomonas_calceolata.AAC.6
MRGNGAPDKEGVALFGRALGAREHAQSASFVFFHTCLQLDRSVGFKDADRSCVTILEALVRYGQARHWCVLGQTHCSLPNAITCAHRQGQCACSDADKASPRGNGVFGLGGQQTFPLHNCSNYPGSGNMVPFCISFFVEDDISRVVDHLPTVP